MNYLILVSHGQFSEGLRDALSMFIGDDIEQVRAIGLKSGEDTTNFGSRFKSLLSDIAPDDGLIVLGDIIGGSPLTTVTDILNQQQRLSETIVFGGMNFPMALNAAILKNTMSGDDLVSAVLHEATTAVKQFELIEADEDEDEI